ncbi:MAG: protoheme IX farnesyltransferase [Melioribacteraceae bacterium]
MSSSITLGKNKSIEQSVTRKNSLEGRKNKVSFFQVLASLTKIRITFMVAVTTMVGYILFNGSFGIDLLYTCLGVFVLACGASALNEFQERKSDKLMERTHTRPIPSGEISPTNGLLIALGFILVGLFILWQQSLLVMYLGLLTLVWYNFVYTPLKYKFALAILPGSLVGALPPMIGYVAAGGDVFHFSILSLATFLFIWQIPHFWLLLLMYDDDYKKGGFPTLTNILSREHISQITYIWIFTLVLSSFMLPFFSLSITTVNFVLLALIGLTLLSFSFKIIFQKDRMIFRNTFMYINIYALAILLLISIDKIINA